MAFWRRYNHRVEVFTMRDGRQNRLPRIETKHLDSEPDHNVDTWVRNWTLAHESAKRQYETLDHSATIDLVEGFSAYLESRHKSPKTVAQHRHNLTRYCLPFFVQVEGLTHPIQWPGKSIRLLAHLQNQGVAARTINICNVSMRVFWRWLVEEGKAEGILLLRNAIIGQVATPLSFAVTPEQVLAYRYATKELRLLALLGFFFSLRPQELVALRACDFTAGAKAGHLEACKVMAHAGLYGRFAVHIHRQRVGNSYKAPKVNSRGWVACFHETAAHELVATLNAVVVERSGIRDELLFGHQLNWWFALWRRGGYQGLALKDLRRASLYYLGNHTELPFHAIKNHARHADPSTTALYTRRPGDEQVEELGALDLNA